MKNQFLILLALLISLLFSACGRRETPPAASTPADTPATSGAVATMPDSAAPEDLPPCPGFVQLESSTGNEQSGSVVLISSQTVPSLVDFYTTDLAADGWILGASVPQGGEQSLPFSKGSRFLRFQIGPSENPAGISRLRIAWEQAAGAEEVREAHEPETGQAPSTLAEESP